MRLTSASARIVLAAVLSVVRATAADAEPYCPGFQRDVPISGSLQGVNDTDSHVLAERPNEDERMYSCDTLWLEGTATNHNSIKGAVFSISVRNHGENQVAWWPATIIAPRSTITFRLPVAGQLLGTPYFNLDIVKRINVRSQHFTNGPEFTVTYSLTVRISSRPGYNRGGSTLSDALPLSLGRNTVHGTMPFGRHQWFRVLLQPQGSVRISGILTNIHASYPAYYGTVLYDRTGKLLKSWATITVPGNGQASFQNQTYTNATSQPLDVYITLRNAGWGIIEPFAITIHVYPPTGTFHLTLNAFLPYDHIDDPHPWPLGDNRIFEGDGDNRPFAENGSSRTSQIMDLWNPYEYPSNPPVAAGPFDWAAMTQQYETSSSLGGSGRLTVAARNDWLEGAPLKTDWGVPTNQGEGCSVSRFGSSLSVYCELETPNGVYPAWLDPQIEYRLTLTFQFGPTSDVNYTISGCHKLFPAYEIWAAGQAILTDINSGEPFSIMIPCEWAVEVNRSGVITVP